MQQYSIPPSEGHYSIRLLSHITSCRSGCYTRSRTQRLNSTLLSGEFTSHPADIMRISYQTYIHIHTHRIQPPQKWIVISNTNIQECKRSSRNKFRCGQLQHTQKTWSYYVSIIDRYVT